MHLIEDNFEGCIRKLSVSGGLNYIQVNKILLFILKLLQTQVTNNDTIYFISEYLDLIKFLKDETNLKHTNFDFFE